MAPWNRQKKDKLRYLEVLAEAYPMPLSHTELAAKAGVSKPAVTKAKESLRDLCDLRELTYDRFVLRDDPKGAGSIVESYYNNGRIVKFLSSKYFVFLVKKAGIHKEMSKAWPTYGAIFEKADTDLMIEYAMSNLALLSEIRFTTKLKSPNVLLQLRNLESLEPTFRKMRLPIKDEESLARFLRLRDKWFVLLNQEISKFACSLGILRELPESGRGDYEEVYKKTIEYYLKRFFVSITADLAKSASPLIELKAEHYAIGQFYHTENLRQIAAKKSG